MTGFNFKGVEEVKDKSMTRPGTIALFKISAVKFAPSEQKGTLYMGVTFSRKEDEFSHRFYMTEKALGRVKSLVKHAAAADLNDENVTQERLIALLTGKELAVKVTARIDEENGKAYPDLSFGGFCQDTDKLSDLAFNNKELELNANAAAVYASASAAKPEGATASTGTTGTALVEEEIF
jgi:hypothetical protein